MTGTAAAFAMLYFLRDILIPFIIAFVLAVLVRALVRFIRNRLSLIHISEPTRH